MPLEDDDERESRHPIGPRRAQADDVFRVSSKTLVPIGSLVTIFAFLIRIWLYLQDVDRAQEDEIKDLLRRVNEIERTTWTCESHRHFFDELRLANPKLVAPADDGLCGKKSQ